MVLLLLAALPGVVALVRLARRRDRAAIAACVLAVWIVVAALFSGAPRLALGGVFGRESSALIAIGALGLWALGRELSEPGRRLLVPVLLTALALSALVGFFQILLSIDTGVFARTADRASGLTTNPVYFGSLMGGAAALAATRWRQRQRPGSCSGSSAVFAFAVNLSGSRVALGATVLVLAYITARAGWKLGWQLPVAYLAGTLISVWFVAAVGDGGQGATDRVGVRRDEWTARRVALWVVRVRRAPGVRMGSRAIPCRDPGAHVGGLRPRARPERPGADHLRRPQHRRRAHGDVGDRRARARRGVRVACRTARERRDSRRSSSSSPSPGSCNRPRCRRCRLR